MGRVEAGLLSKISPWRQSLIDSPIRIGIGKERKSITASIKDLDSVVAKLDAILVYLVVIITFLVFLSLIPVLAELSQLGGKALVSRTQVTFNETTEGTS